MSPIIGLTTSEVTMPPVIGALRKGDVKQQNRWGKDLTYFRFTARSDKSGDMEAAFTAAYGAEPSRLLVYLPTDDIDELFMAFCEEYSAGGIVHRCDRDWLYERDRTTGKFYRTNEPCPYGPQAERPRQRTTSVPGCKQVGRLHVILPELVGAGYWGVVTALTHSEHDIANLYRSLTDAKNRFGSLQGAPFYLYRAPVDISTPSGTDGKRARREKWLLFLTPAQEFVHARMEAARTLALTSGQAQLPPPDDDMTVEGEAREVDHEADCEKCGNPLTPAYGKSVAWLAGYTASKYNRVLCASCAKDEALPDEEGDA